MSDSCRIHLFVFVCYWCEYFFDPSKSGSWRMHGIVWCALISAHFVRFLCFRLALASPFDETCWRHSIFDIILILFGIHIACSWNSRPVIGYNMVETSKCTHYSMDIFIQRRLRQKCHDDRSIFFSYVWSRSCWIACAQHIQLTPFCCSDWMEA